MLNLSETLIRALARLGSVIAMFFLAILGAGGAVAQIGHGTLGPIDITTSDADQLKSSRVEIDSIPEVETAKHHGPAWYSGPMEVSLSVFAAGSARPGYAVKIVSPDSAPRGTGQAVIPIEVQDEVINETMIEGCASPRGEGTQWVPTSPSERSGLDRASSLVRPVRFC